MARRISLIKCLVVAAILYSMTLTFIFIKYSPGVGVFSKPTETDDSAGPLGQRHRVASNSDKDNRDSEKGDKSDEIDWGPHKMAVIVPFRDRLEELLEFTPYIHNYLTKKKVRHKIFVINQVDNLR